MSKKYSRFRLAGLTTLMFATIAFPNLEARMDVPYVALFVIAGAWSVFLVLTVRNEALRNAALLSASVMFALAVVEASAYYVGRAEIIVTRTIPEMWRQKSTGFGSIPSPNTTTEFKEYLDRRLIADVVYKFDANGLREFLQRCKGVRIR